MSNPNNDWSALDHISEADAGVFLEKYTQALRDTVLKTVANGQKGKTGKVILEIGMAKVPESDTQIHITHKLTVEQPTRSGKRVEVSATQTLQFACAGGRLAFVPDNQEKLDLKPVSTFRGDNKHD